MTARRLTLLALSAFALAACAKSDGRTVLTVYSPHGKELLAYTEAEFEKANPTVDVQWVDMGAQEVLERLRAERANPQADVWFGATAEIFDRAAKESLLVAYAPSWKSAVDTAARDPQDRWYGTYLTPEVIAYNTQAIDSASAPKDWDDVLDPKWKGRVVIRDPVASGSMRAIFGAQILRSIRETGSPERGYQWLRRLDANTKEYVLNPTILYQKLGRQEGAITLYNMPDIATLTQRVGIPVAYVFPKSGTPLLVDGIAIVRGTPHEAAAKTYYEFVSSKHQMIEASRRFIRIPARTDIPRDSLPPEIAGALGQIKPMPMDRALLAAHLDEWMTYWDANIRNRGATR
ncbi:MAG TPA: extracellular solute-binding protein [Gemmatimonadaceae bacterium]|nr:extracellular solute-binding protein [Gemmatimonadaceae bacterium]